MALGQVHVVSVGLSSLNHLLKGGDLPPDLSELRGLSRAELEEKLSREGELRKKLRESLSSFLFPGGPPTDERVAQARRKSAELNALLGFLSAEHPDEGWSARIGRVEKVYLLHTDTATGRVVSRALVRAMEGMGFPSVEPRELRGFAERDFEAGLRDLREEIRRILRKHGGSEILLNPTGGFKPESGAMAIIAAESGLRTYYIHETFDEVVVIPPATELKVRITREEVIDAAVDLWLGISLDSLIGWVFTGEMLLFALWLALSGPFLVYRVFRLWRLYSSVSRET